MMIYSLDEETLEVVIVPSKVDLLHLLYVSLQLMMTSVLKYLIFPL